MGQFSNAQHITVERSTFNEAKGDIHIHHNSNNSEYGLRDLSLAVSHGAVHDSSERYPPPNCHPGTREAIQKEILDWIHDESSALPFFWLYGSTGVGKTAILQAIAEFLCSSPECDENLGGSFFFSRGKQGRDQGHFLFLTIAYQLALNVPGLRQHINHIMEVYPKLETKSIAVQLQALIVNAFQSLKPFPPCSYFVIIDGLDQCQGKETQLSILRLLYETIATHKLPLRFLIASRPESHIRATFENDLCEITRRVALDETFSPGRDIQVFLEDGFAKIYVQHAGILEQPWPAQDVIHLLVQRSSGQFIYAATVLQFVGADFCSPTKQLELILNPGSMAFSDLDQLYTQILSVYPSTANIVQVLGIIVAFDARTLRPEVIEDILGMGEGEVRLVLQCLSSLIAFVGDKNEKYLTEWVDANIGSVHLIHASFRDYLMDSSRSGPFHVNEQEHMNWATTRSFSLITKWIGRSWRIPTATQFPHSQTWDYFKSYLAEYFIHSPKLARDAITIDIDNLVQEFWKISSGRGADVFFPAMRCLLHVMEDVAKKCDNSSQTDSELEVNDDEFFMVFEGCQKMLDQSFTSAFSKSGDMGDLLKFLPGIVVQNGLTLQEMADLYGVKMDLLERLSKCTIEPLTSSHAQRHSYMLEGYLSDFLRDRDRSQFYYCDPMLHHIFIWRFLSLLGGSSDCQSDDLAQYVQDNLYEHLCAATEIFLSGQNIPGDALEILNDLDRIAYSRLNANHSHSIPCLVPYTLRPILRWATMLNNRLKDVTVFISGSNLVERVRQLIDRTYREILCMETDGSITTITISPPFRLAPRSVSFETPPCRVANPSVVQLSWELLAQVSVEGRILSSFSDFMTTPERSGPLSIIPDVYHTQITEYSLETVFRSNNNSRPSRFSIDNLSLLPDWSFEEHISGARPTEAIIYLLQSILVNPIQYTAHSSLMNNLLQIEWLKPLHSLISESLDDVFFTPNASPISMAASLLMSPTGRKPSRKSVGLNDASDTVGLGPGGSSHPLTPAGPTTSRAMPAGQPAPTPAAATPVLSTRTPSTSFLRFTAHNRHIQIQRALHALSTTPSLSSPSLELHSKSTHVNSGTAADQSAENDKKGKSGTEHTKHSSVTVKPSVPSTIETITQSAKSTTTSKLKGSQQDFTDMDQNKLSSAHSPASSPPPVCVPSVPTSSTANGSTVTTAAVKAVTTAPSPASSPPPVAVSAPAPSTGSASGSTATTTVQATVATSTTIGSPHVLASPKSSKTQVYANPGTVVSSEEKTEQDVVVDTEVPSPKEKEKELDSSILTLSTSRMKDKGKEKTKTTSVTMPGMYYGIGDVISERLGGMLSKGSSIPPTFAAFSPLGASTFLSSSALPTDGDSIYQSLVSDVVPHWRDRIEAFATQESLFDLLTKQDVVVDTEVPNPKAKGEGLDSSILSLSQLRKKDKGKEKTRTISMTMPGTHHGLGGMLPNGSSIPHTFAPLDASTFLSSPAPPTNGNSIYKSSIPDVVPLCRDRIEAIATQESLGALFDRLPSGFRLKPTTNGNRQSMGKATFDSISSISDSSHHLHSGSPGRSHPTSNFHTIAAQSQLHSESSAIRSPPKTLSSKVNAMTLSTPGELLSKGTRWYTSLVPPLAPLPLGPHSTSTQSASTSGSGSQGKLFGIVGGGKESILDLTRSGVSQTTMASVENVRGLVKQQSQNGFEGGFLGKFVRK